MNDRPDDNLTVSRPHGRRFLLGLIGLALGLGGISILGLLGDRRQFAYSYLTGFIFLATLGTGALFWIFIHHITDAGWSVVLRRLLENYARSLPLLLLLFIPIVINAPIVYRWTKPVELSVIAKRAWLNMPFFTIRGVIYLLSWSTLGWWMGRMSIKQDVTMDDQCSKRMQALSAPGMIVLAFTTTYASFDWIMSLDPTWASTIFGVYFWAGAIVASLALLTLTIVLLHSQGLLQNTITTEHLHDLGKLLFGFTIFWTYIAFSQYLLIWYANLPEETSYFILRRTGTWNIVSWSLAIGHFVVPFLMLMPRTFKRNPLILGLVACWILVFHYVDLYWLIMPTLHRSGFLPHWLDLTVPLAMFSATLALATWLSLGKPLIPVGDPRIQESLSFHNI